MAGKAPLEEVARILARACGHGGSCAEYLYKTVKHLDAFGIRDRNLWRLQELVAKEIEQVHEVADEGAPGKAKASTPSCKRRRDTLSGGMK